MLDLIHKQQWATFKVLAIAIVPTILFLMISIYSGFSIQDEGHLWHGVQRTIGGDIPILDFASYDVGRYYWSSAVMLLLNDNGILGLRISVSIFQMFGLYVGLKLIVQQDKDNQKDRLDYTYFIVSGVILLLWMFPRQKLFDISLSIFLLSALVSLLRTGTLRKFFLLGLVTGAVAVFGRNHGVYGVWAALWVFVWFAFMKNIELRLMKGILYWGSGITIGYSPVLLMLVFFPDFNQSFWESIFRLFEQGATNIPKPIPWPWDVNFKNINLNLIRELLIGLFFVSVLIYGVVGSIFVFVAKAKNNYISPALIGTVFLAQPYTHFAFSRADVNHLAQGVFPFLIGCLIFFGSKSRLLKWSGGGLLLLMTLLISYNKHPIWMCHTKLECKSAQVGETVLNVQRKTSQEIELIHQLYKKYGNGHDSVYFTPFWPGAYPVLGLKSPTWEAYALWPRSEEHQREEIQRLIMSSPTLVVIQTRGLGGKSELAFENTNPLIYQYVKSNLKFVPEESNKRYEVYVPYN